MINEFPRNVSHMFSESWLNNISLITVFLTNLHCNLTKEGFPLCSIKLWLFLSFISYRKIYVILTRIKRAWWNKRPNADKKRVKQGGYVSANKKVRLDWNVSPTSICETLHCRGSWLLVAGPDKSLWSLMFVSDRGWVHNCLEARGHDIHLLAIGSSNTVRVIASATQPQHAAEAHFTKLTCPSFLSATVPCAWEMVSKSKVQ